MKLEKKDAEIFYKVHETKPFYNDLCNYLSSGPIVAMILEKVDAVSENRKVMGATDPANADEGTIRKNTDYIFKVVFVKSIKNHMNISYKNHIPRIMIILIIQYK